MYYQSMKKVLFVLPFLPYPMASGGHQAIYNGIAATIPNAEVFITYPEFFPQDKERALFAAQFDRAIHILPIIDHRSQRGKRLLDLIYKTKYFIKSIISGENGRRKDPLPYDDWIKQLFPKSEGFINHVNEIIETNSIDLVQCEMIENLALVVSLPKTVKRVFVHHEIGFIRKSLHPVISEKHSKEGLANLEINRFIEIALLNQYDTVITLSGTDAEKLKEAGVNTEILPSFAIVNTPPEKEIVSHRHNHLTFIGPEWHPSNKDGLLWFLENCWKSLKQVDSSYELSIIGNWTSETKKDIESSFQDVHFLGFIDDLRTVVKDSIMIVPIRIGSGIRMKILEACMLGAPVVSTAIGAEGLPLLSGKDCFIDDTAEGFVDCILSLKDEQTRIDFISSAQKKILQHYSLEALIDNRKGIYL